jgi:L-asparaginase/Glu-tRNA(Gln) amidotransferase subunit D
VTLYKSIGIMHKKSIEWLNTPKRSSTIPLPSKLENLLSIPIVYAYPGATPNCLDGYISSGFKALVVVAYGSGNVNDHMYAAIESVIKSGMKVVLVTNCRYGGIYAEYGGIGGI